MWLQADLDLAEELKGFHGVYQTSASEFRDFNKATKPLDLSSHYM